MTETFSQQFCTLAPCGAGGRILTGARMPNCLVEVADSELTLIQAPATLVAKTPVAAVRIVTPPALRKVGTGVILNLDGKLLAVEFDRVYRRQLGYGKPRKSTAVKIARNFFSLNDITTLPKSMRLARALTRDFTAALVAAGAVAEGQ